MPSLQAPVRASRRRGVLLAALGLGALWLGPGTARATALDDLRQFVQGVRTGQADFTQVVSSPDGARKRRSSGHFEFARPNRFRFAYAKPDEQLIVADGQHVWLYDPDLNQVTQRPFGQALGATPAALLAGASLDHDFQLKALPDDGGLAWVEARPKAQESSFQSLRIGFKAGVLSELDILDAFGQRSRLSFTKLEPNIALPRERFEFKPPAGADLIRQ